MTVHQLRKSLTSYLNIWLVYWVIYTDWMVCQSLNSLNVMIRYLTIDRLNSTKIYWLGDKNERMTAFPFVLVARYDVLAWLPGRSLNPSFNCEWWSVPQHPVVGLPTVLYKWVTELIRCLPILLIINLTVVAAITRLTHRLIDWLIPWLSCFIGAVITRMADWLIGLLNNRMNLLHYISC